MGLCIVIALTIVFKAFEREGQLEPLKQKRGIIVYGGSYAVESSFFVLSYSNVKLIQ